MEALISPSLEDGIFLGWATLRDLISGPIYDNQFQTPITKLRSDILEPEISQNHANTIRLAGTPRRRQEYRDYKPNKPCPGCGEDKTHHHREDCPNKNKICYYCGKMGHIREVCRKNSITIRNERQRTRSWPAGITGEENPPLVSEFKDMSQYPYQPIRSLGEPGTPAIQHKKWSNDQPCRATEIVEEKTDGLTISDTANQIQHNQEI